jgi:hypothetical protein
MHIGFIEKENTYEFSGCKTPEDVSDIIIYLNKRHEDPEVKYIASELSENLVKTNLTGTVRVNCQKVETIITGGDKSQEAEAFIKIAKHSINQNENIKYKERGGKGFVSILRLGWDISVEKLSETAYKVSASK